MWLFILALLVALVSLLVFWILDYGACRPTVSDPNVEKWARSDKGSCVAVKCDDKYKLYNGRCVSKDYKECTRTNSQYPMYNQTQCETRNYCWDTEKQTCYDYFTLESADSDDS
jgi:hypothetical protein